MTDTLMPLRERAVPPVAADFYGFGAALPEEDLELLGRLRAWLEDDAASVVEAHWARGTFAHELVPGLAALELAGLTLEGPGGGGRSQVLNGFVALELARVDPSFATFFGVHSGLAMGAIDQCGSDEQKARWLPAMARFERIGAFALTEPDVGSGVARGLRTTARREGDEWVLTGEKLWIGNATFADLTIVWAVDEADGSVKGFVVERGTPGFTASKLEGKVALRGLENAHVVLDGCRVPEADRLQRARGYLDAGRVLRDARVGVAWLAVGCAMGAYERALRYAGEREQFGRPIAGFQLVQDLLVRMLGNITASLAMCVRLSELQDQGAMDDAHASLAKVFATVRMRETVGCAREVLGANGIRLEHGVARFMADAEAIYSYEGTREINALIVGRAITGLSAFR